MPKHASPRFVRAKQLARQGMLLLGAGLMFSGAAVASSDLAERVSQSDQVSLLKVKRVGNLVNPAMTYRGMMAAEAVLYTAQVLKDWKGNGQANVTFRVDFSDCVNMLHKDQSYLVFSQRNDDGNLQTYGCADMIQADAAQDLVAQLDNLAHFQVAQD